MGGVTQVVAHRGSSADIPEHTLAAYVQAVAEGADALECDVRLTADGHLVCVHDRRIDRTSDGTGVVSVMTLADLDRRDFGRWRDAGTSRPTSSGPAQDEPVVLDERRRVLTLERLLELVVDSEREVGPGDRDEAPDSLRRPSSRSGRSSCSSASDSPAPAASRTPASG